MAESLTPRLGLTEYSAGTDLHPDRLKFNNQQKLLDKIVAIAQHGTLAARPAAGRGGAIYWATDSSRLYYDDGTAWREVNTTGGGGAGAPISVGGSPAEGSSARAARADHTHALPLATASAPGALSAADKSKLDNATASPIENTVIMRGSSGETNIKGVYLSAAPVSNSHATRKDYVDTQVATRAPESHNHSASDVNSGVLAPARLPAATQSAAGALSAADKKKLDSATSAPTASTLVMNDGNGRIQAAAPAVAADVANKSYVDSAASNASNLSSGTVNPARIANATSALDGLMSKADKSKLDAATTANTGGTVVTRSSNGRFNIGSIAIMSAPSSADDATRKDYVDAQIATRAQLEPTSLGASVNLDTVTDTGPYHQSANVNATLALNYPSPEAGFMEVVNTGNFIYQWYTTYTTGTKMYFRAQYATSAWSVWKQVSIDGHTHSADEVTSGTFNAGRLPIATQTTQGAMSWADKKKLDSASSTSAANTLMMTDSNGRFSAVAPASGGHVANKTYVDGLIAGQVSLAGDLSSADLNTVITPGDYYASSGSNATLANNYPVNGTVGTLSVRRFHSSSVWVTQVLTVWSRNDVWVRSANSSTGWTAWSLQASVSVLESGLNGKSDNGHKHSGSDITSGTISPLRIANATSAIDGLMPKADKALLDTANVSSDANSLVKRDGNGNTRFGVVLVDSPQSTYGHSLARKDYVDGKTWSASDTTSGVFAPARIPVVTQSVHGAMSAADKKLLDSATAYATGYSLMQRMSNGQAYTADPTAADSIANKRYVDSKFSDVFIGTELPDSANLNNYITPNLYHNSQNASIATGSNYPSGTAGMLEVSRNANSTMIYQVWTEYSSSGSQYYRTRYNGTWYAWKEVANEKNVNRLVNADLPTIPSTFSYDSYTNPGIYEIPNGALSANIWAGGILEVFRGNSGKLYQRRTRQFQGNGSGTGVEMRIKATTTWNASW